MQLSLIVPVAPGDESWTVLLQDLYDLDRQCGLVDSEVLLVTGSATAFAKIQQALADFSCADGTQAFAKKLIALQAGDSRASSMNAAATHSRGEFLWFVHADSRLSTAHWDVLGSALKRAPEVLHYFDLQFSGARYMKINALGVWLRSRLFMTPFGDQAFCLRRSLFVQLGGYPEEATYGEDHLLVWRALQQGIRLRPTGVALLTSARKYEQRGWLKTTALHVYLWAKQAAPECLKLLRLRWTKV